MRTTDIGYQIDGKTYTGYLADDEQRQGARPGVLVCHQGGGLTEHAKRRARMLAELGYVAFALDMYGEVATSRERAMALITDLSQNPPELRKRASAGLAALKAQAHVDPQRLAAIGYCFGGAVVLELARSAPELACVVAFHPGLTGLPEKDDRSISGKVLVCAGAADPLIPATAREKFIALMNACGADWQLHTYGKAGHGFTDHTIDAFGMPGFFHHEPTDKRSWATMRELFAESLGAV